MTRGVQARRSPSIYFLDWLASQVATSSEELSLGRLLSAMVNLLVAK
jgi:hypothetical protein